MRHATGVMPSRGPSAPELSWWWVLVFAAAALALYANALGHPFLSDDPVFIERNPTVAHPSAAGLGKLWTSSLFTGVNADGTTVVLGSDRNPYRPVTIFSFWLNAAIGGIDPVRFRIVNVFLHVIAAWLVGLLASRWSGARAGLIAGALVLLHPIATDLINRILGRSELLVVVGMAGFLATQRAAQRAGWTWPRCLGAALAAAVAFGAKESGVVLVPLAALHAWLGRARGANAPAAPRRGRGVFALAFPAALYVVGRVVAVGTPHFERSHYDLLESPVSQWSLLERVPVTLTLAADYVRMLLAPWPLMALDFPARFPRWTDAGPWLGALVLAAAVAGTVWTALRRSRFALPLAWWLLSFLLVSHLFVPTWTYREVRLAYPMLAGIAPVLGWLVAERCWGSRRARATALLVLAAAGTIAGVLVVLRNAQCGSDFALAEADVRHDPLRPSAQIKLGDMLELAARSTEAERAFELVVRLAPDSYQAWYQLAGFYERHGRRDDARDAYERAAAVDPSFPFAFVGLGLIALESGALDQAQDLFTRAERADPGDPYAQYNLAVVDTRRGRSADAIARLERLARRHPEFRLATEGLATLREGQPGAAPTR